MPGYGTPLSLTLPTINGVAKESAAAPLINTALSAIIARLESKIGAADLDINADVSFKSGATYSGARDLHRAAFQSLTGALTAASNPNTVYVLNGDLHYIDAAGNLVQITASGAVNVSTTGGITGSGYGTGGVEVNWDSGNSRFAFKSGAGADDFADVQVADLLLRDGTGNTIRFQAPAIASDYSMTLPAALPGSTLLLQLSAAGLVTASNSALGSLTLASGAHVTLAGSGSYKRGGRVTKVHGSTCTFNAADAVTLLTSGVSWDTGAGSSTVHYALDIQDDERLTQVAANVSNANGGTIGMTIRSVDDSGAVTILGTDSTGSAGDQTLTVSGLTATGATTIAYIASVVGSDEDQVYRLAYTKDVP